VSLTFCLISSLVVEHCHQEQLSWGLISYPIELLIWIVFDVVHLILSVRKYALHWNKVGWL